MWGPIMLGEITYPDVGRQFNPAEITALHHKPIPGTVE